MKVAIFGSVEYPKEQGVEYERLNIHEVVQGSGLECKYDRVVVSNCIPELRRDQVMLFLSLIHDALNPMGELIIHVPSAEYACKQMFTNNHNNTVFYMLYGNDTNPFRACYTLLSIRTLVERSGYVVRKAAQELMEIQTTTGEKDVMPVHALIGVRND